MGEMSWIAAGLVLFGFAGPSACVGVAYSIGSTGLLLGPMLCITVTVASAQGAVMLRKLGAAFPKADSLDTLGEAVLGKPGQVWGMVIQQGNFLLYLPVALLVCGQALQGCLSPASNDDDWASCDDYWVFIVAALCFASTQLRSLSNVTELSFISLISVILVIVLSLVVVLETDNDGKDDAWLVGNPAMSQDVGATDDRTADEVRIDGWYTFALGFSTTAWAYVPSFLTVELANPRVMKDPASFDRSIWLSAAMNVVVFCAVGTVIVSKWGWDVNDPVMIGTASNFGLWPSDTTKSRILNGFWFVASLISYALDSVPLGRGCQRAWAPKFDLDDWSLPAILAYAGITLPTFLLGLSMAIFVPNLFCMLAITTALTVPWANLIYPAVLYYTWLSHGSPTETETDNNRLAQNSDLSESLLEANIVPKPVSAAASVNTAEKPASGCQANVAFVFITGVVVFVACCFGAYGKITVEYVRGPSSIGCDGWVLYKSDDGR